MKRYQGMVFSQARKAFETQDEAEDFTQEVFLKAYESLSTFRGEAQFSTWVYQIARNEISKYFKKKKPFLEALEETHHATATAKMDVSSGILDRMAKEEEGNLLRSLISRLPAVYRKPIILHYFENRSLKEISDDLDIKLNTIKSHISRGKDLIRKWWHHEK
jgi:RNA polymerase sigma-70 factor (ECF subfamily)